MENLSVSCRIFSRYFYWDSQEKRSFMDAMFFKPTLRLRNWWIRMESRARLIMNSIVELVFCYQHPTVSLDIPKYSCFTRILWCPTWYKTFWKLLNTKPKQWRICHFYNHSLQSLCHKALPRLLPRWKHTEGRLALARDGQVQLPVSRMARAPGEESNSATGRSCPCEDSAPPDWCLMGQDRLFRVSAVVLLISQINLIHLMGQPILNSFMYLKSIYPALQSFFPSGRRWMNKAESLATAHCLLHRNTSSQTESLREDPSKGYPPYF